LVKIVQKSDNLHEGLSKSYCCRRRKIVIEALLTATKVAKNVPGFIAVFRWQQWLRERTAVLRYTRTYMTIFLKLVTLQQPIL
jgi:hypothetical protein